jgi:hypothetical protein
LAAVLLGVALATSACSHGGPTHSHASTAVVRHFAGLPKDAEPARDQPLPESQPCLSSAGAGMVYVTTWASGSCPRIPTSVTTRGGTLVIRTVEHDPTEGDTACSDDLAATTSVVRLPRSLAGSTPLLVQIDGVSTRFAVRPS